MRASDVVCRLRFLWYSQSTVFQSNFKADVASSRPTKSRSLPLYVANQVRLVYRPLRIDEKKKNQKQNQTTHRLGLGRVFSRIPFLGLLGRVRDLPGRLSELLLGGGGLRHREVGPSGVAVPVVSSRVVRRSRSAWLCPLLKKGRRQIGRSVSTTGGSQWWWFS